jgi:hypothetical protein
MPRIQAVLEVATVESEAVDPITSAEVLAFPSRFKLEVLDNGSCEVLKAIVHAAALGLAVLMTLYNAAAWIRRREPHLAINSVLYAALTEWERQTVARHLAQRR